jgi:hypothetical protein
MGIVNCILDILCLSNSCYDKTREAVQEYCLLFEIRIRPTRAGLLGSGFYPRMLPLRGHALNIRKSVRVERRQRRMHEKTESKF